MSTSDILLANAGAIAGLMVAVWLVSLPLQNVSIIDIVWGLGFVLVAWTTWGLAAADDPQRLLLPVMTSLWGCRLSLHLAFRNLGHGEDKRYAAMRERVGTSFAVRSLLTVFGLQGALMWIIALPLQHGIPATGEPSLWQAAGVLVFACGLVFESLADWQLTRFRSDPANSGTVLDHGLWRWSRHPNYFGDFLVWWGLYGTAVAGGGPWWTIVSPVLMSVLLMRVSGVTLLERSLADSRPGYADYVRRTNAFFPWPPAGSR